MKFANWRGQQLHSISGQCLSVYLLYAEQTRNCSSLPPYCFDPMTHLQLILTTTSENRKWEPRLVCDNVQHPPSQSLVDGVPCGCGLLWMDCPGHAGVQGSDRAGRLAGKEKPWQVACVSEALKCWGARHTICESISLSFVEVFIPRPSMFRFLRFFISRPSVFRFLRFLFWDHHSFVLLTFFFRNHQSFVLLRAFSQVHQTFALLLFNEKHYFTSTS